MYIKSAIAMSLLFVTSCAMMKDYAASTNKNSSHITITRELGAPLLGSTTYIYEVSSDRQCNGDSSIPDTRFMVLDEGNPLVSDFNVNGVDVEPNKPISLVLYSIAGPANQCMVIISFTPETETNYQIKLLGRLDYQPNTCKAELYATPKNTNMITPQGFEYHNACNG
jgi:hypothetical protein